MRLIISMVLVLLCFHFSMGQKISKSVWNYSQTESNGLLIENSLPKGGGYTDTNGKTFVYRVYFTRVANEGNIPMELTVNFPTDSFPIPSSPDFKIRFFIPSDTMTLAKEKSYGYGLNLKSLFDADVVKPNKLHGIINPKEDRLFYVVEVFCSDPNSGYNGNGVGRAEVVLKGQNLFYSINLLDPLQIPIGNIAVRK